MNTPQQIHVYMTDADGAYINATTASEFPLAPGTFNVPFGALLTQPPPAPAGHVQVAVADTWHIVEDHRKLDLYRKDTAERYTLKISVVVSDQPARYAGLGPVPDWLTTLVPPAPGSTWSDDGWIAPPPPAPIEPPAQEEPAA